MNASEFHICLTERANANADCGDTRGGASHCDLLLLLEHSAREQETKATKPGTVLTVSENAGLHAQALFMHGAAQGGSAASFSPQSLQTLDLLGHARLHACLTADGKVTDPI